jgi:hypothetical protein
MLLRFFSHLVRFFTVAISGADLDPGSVPFLLLDSGSGMGKKSGSGLNNPDHISKSIEIETIFLLKYLNSLKRIRDGKIRIRDKHPGSATLVATNVAMK